MRKPLFAVGDAVYIKENDEVFSIVGDYMKRKNLSFSTPMEVFEVVHVADPIQNNKYHYMVSIAGEKLRDFYFLENELTPIKDVPTFWN